MRRVIILGPGGSGKSTLARSLGEITRIPVIELDKVFWQPGLTAMPRDRWMETQRDLIAADAWIMDGDLGPYDALEIRLARADTVIMLDFPIALCAWRAIRRGRERMDFWLWLLRYRRESRPRLLDAITRHAPGAALHLLTGPVAARRFLHSPRDHGGLP